jgi:hypothetical protein
MRSTSSFPVALSLISIYVENVVWYVVEDLIINLNNFNCFSSLVIQAQRFLLSLDGKVHILADR